MSTPLPAVGVPLAARPGQFGTHAPVHAVVVPWSFSNRYRVLPFGPTRYCPNWPLLATLTVAPFDAAAAGADDDDDPAAAVVGALEVDFFDDELPHAPSARVRARAAPMAYRCMT